MIGDCNQVENPRMISTKRCKSLISKIVKDETHPLYPYITTLPHEHLRVPWSRIERSRKSFLAYAIKLFNSDRYKQDTKYNPGIQATLDVMIIMITITLCCRSM